MYVHMCVLNLYPSIIFFQDNPSCIPSSEACTNSENPIIDPVVTRVCKYIRKSVHLYVLIGIEMVKYMDDIRKSFQIEECPKMQSGEENFRNHDLYIRTYLVKYIRTYLVKYIRMYVRMLSLCFYVLYVRMYIPHVQMYLCTHFDEFTFPHSPTY